MYAVIEAGGMQFKVSEGDRVRVPKVSAEVGERFEISDVLLLSDGGKVQIGTPTVEGARVVTSVLEHGRDKKIVILKMKRRKNYRRKQGHRQGYTLLSIDRIIKPEAF